MVRRRESCYGWLTCGVEEEQRKYEKEILSMRWMGKMNNRKVGDDDVEMK